MKQDRESRCSYGIRQNSMSLATQAHDTTSKELLKQEGYQDQEGKRRKKSWK